MRTQPEVRGVRTRTVLPRTDTAPGLGLGFEAMLVLGGGGEEVEGASTWLMSGRESPVEVTTSVLGLCCVGAP